jgi:osmotically-inducible protein OsmY
MAKLYRTTRFLVCFVLVYSFLMCTAMAQKETPGQYIDDTIITTKVKTAIFEEPSLKTLQIEVETYKGVVQLSGFVDTKASVKKAGEVASKVEGVVSVKNDLIVK